MILELKKQHAGARQKRSTEELIISYSCLACAAIVSPFILLRLLQADYLLALVDLIIVVSVAAIGLFTWVARKVRITRWLMNICCMVGVIASLYLKGAAASYWLYPFMVVSFFLSEIRYAFLFNATAALLSLPVLIHDKEAGELLVILGALLMTNLIAYIFASWTRHQRELLSKMATIDHLTGVKNRRALTQTLRESVEIKSRTGEGGSIILMDLDYFKQVNDRHGHSKGDQLLIHFCQLVSDNIRLTDRLFRYGGEEFVIILRGCTLQQAMMLAEKLRRAVLDDERLKTHGVTVSSGVAALQHGESEEQWLHRVDSALYQSKNNGRNQITPAEDDADYDDTETAVFSQ